MFERISRGWRLGMTALSILRQDKKLLIFPLLSGLACLLVSISFAAPFYFSDNVQHMIKDRDAGKAVHNILTYAVLFGFYFMNYVVIIFFNTGLVACAMKRFNGEEPSLSYGFSVAVSRMPQIVAWSLVSASVGVILRIIEQYSDKVGQIVAGLLGMAWNLMTYFVLPVLVVERVGPIDAVKRSCAVLRQAWGESIVANFGTGLLMFLMSLLALIPGVLGFLIGGPFLIAGIGLSILGLLIVSLISSATNTIILAALYKYAAQSTAPQQFDEEMLSGAFVRK
ncbi:MAG TPA: DUF6159 family protein [Planctomycetota bacterium]|nr:DUF6159 family protein [Planctomycetota bacterium]